MLRYVNGDNYCVKLPVINLLTGQKSGFSPRKGLHLQTRYIHSSLSISHNYAAEFLRFGIFPPQISDTGGATYRRNCKMFSALQSTSGPLTHRKKFRPIIGDAILSQTRTKLTKKRGSQFGALLWRHLTPQRKTAI